MQYVGRRIVSIIYPFKNNIYIAPRWIFFSPTSSVILQNKFLESANHWLFSDCRQMRRVAILVKMFRSACLSFVFSEEKVHHST
jgi:hypothetical protein